MPRLLISTVRRNIPHSEPSGFLYLVDRDNFKVIKKIMIDEPAYREVDTNPRGGLRGSRGISIRDDRIALANASVIYQYDPQWNLLGIITHPSMTAIHDILYDGDTIWATSARNDLLFQFDLCGNLLQYYYLRETSTATLKLGWEPQLILNREQILRGELDFRDPRTHDEEIYDRAHVNSVCVTLDGDLLVSMGLVLNPKFAALLYIKSRLVKMGLWSVVLKVNRWLRSLLRMRPNVHSDLVVQPASGHSAVVNISPDGDHQLILALSEVTVPSHSLLTLSDGSVVYSNTTTGEILRLSPQDGKVISSQKVTEGFLRGVTQLDKRTILLGSRQDLIVYDFLSTEVLSIHRIGEDPNEAVYDIEILPEHFLDPPDSFATHNKSIIGFSGKDFPKHQYEIPELSKSNKQG